MYRRHVLKINHTVRQYGFIILWLLFVQAGFSQMKPDSVFVKPKSTKGAMLRSALMPGWGQWYNGEKIKSFIVLGLEAGLATGAVIQNQRYVEERYRSETDVSSIEFYRDSRGQFLWYMGAAHFLNILDAFIDAYLWDFDTSDNLSIMPMIDSQQTLGMTVSFAW